MGIVKRALVMLVLGLCMIVLLSWNVSADGTGTYPSPENGDWVIENETHVWNETIVLNGNLIMEDSGNLTFNNVTLIMNCTFNGEYGIVVNEGGKFYILDYDNNPKTTTDSSNITVNNTKYEFRFLVNSGAEFVMRNSELSECGYTNGEDGRRGLTIKTDNAIIDNSTIYNYFYGIYLYSSSNNTITNNSVYSSNKYSYGIYLYSSSNNKISNNSVSNNTKGIYLRDSNNNLITNNSVFDNDNGIELIRSSNITMRENIMNSNKYNFYVDSPYIFDYYHDIDISNTINEKPIIYIIEKHDLVIDEKTNAGNLGLISCSNVTIKNLILSNNRQGILLLNTTDSLIENCNVSENSHGIYLKYSSNNTISNNNVSNNGDDGICVRDSSNNNQIINNNVSNHYDGIFIRDSSNNNKIINNNVSNNDNGIKLSYSNNNNTITNNNVSNNNRGIFISDSSNNTISNNSVYSNSNGGISLSSSSNNTIINNNVSNNKRGISLGVSSQNNKITNSTISNSTEYDFSLSSNSNITAINTTFNKDKVNFYGEDTELIVRWYLSVKVLDKNANPIPEANVRIQDNENGTFDKNYTTNSKGWINWIVCTEYNETISEKTYYTPHTINASENEKFNQTQVFINESKNLIIIIEKEVLDVKITNPKNDETVKDIVTIIVDIKNATNLEFIAFRISGIELQNSTSNSFEWNTKDYENKEYTIKVTAKDKNYFVWDEIKVTLNNEVPENHPPIITTQNIEETDILELYSVQYEFTDQDITDIHTWQLKTNATWLKITENGNLYGTQTKIDIGSYWVNITVTDNGTPPLFDYTNFTLIVDDFPDFQTFNNETLGVIVTIKHKGFGIVEIKEPKQPPEPTIGLLGIKFADITPQESLEIIWANITIYYKDSDIPKDQEGKALIEESTLKIYYRENSEWKLAKNYGQDTKNKIAWANISHFTIFALLGEEIPQAIEPKLEITNIIFENLTVEGQNITIQANIKNTGNISISNFTVAFYYNDKKIESRQYEKTLEPNIEISINITWQAVIGNHTIKIEIETSEGKLLISKESTEKLKVNKVEILEPKVEIINIFFQKQALVGQNITINATIKNIGTVPISNFSVIFYYGKKVIGLEVFEDILGVGEEITIEVKWKAVLGNHTIKVEVKLGEEILVTEESSEKLEVIKAVEEDGEEEEKGEFPIVLLVSIIIILIIIVTFGLRRGKKAKEETKIVEDEKPEIDVEEAKEPEEKTIVKEKKENEVSEKETKIEEEEQKVEMDEKEEKETKE